MNMILHGIDAPNILHTNTLAENISDIQEKDRYDVILANPPFGGKERQEVQQNFPIKTGETAFLFLQHFIKKLKAGGRAGVVIKNTFLSNTDNASVRAAQGAAGKLQSPTDPGLSRAAHSRRRRQDSGAVLREGRADAEGLVLPARPRPQHSARPTPLTDDDLKEFVALQANFADTEKSWTVDVEDIDPATYDLSVKNPNKAEEDAVARAGGQSSTRWRHSMPKARKSSQAFGGCYEARMERNLLARQLP